MAPEDAPGRRASDHGRYGKLSRERVLVAALGVVDAEGLSALSMRRLGTELGVEAMSLYRYLPGKGALLDGLVEALYQQVEEDLAREAGDVPEGWGAPAATDVPATGAPPASRAAPETQVAPQAQPGAPEARPGSEGAGWRAGLQRIAHAVYAVGLRHPEVVPLLATRMLSVPLARRPAAVLRVDENVLRLLHEGGLDTDTATAAHRAFTAWLLGYLLVDLRAMVDAPEEPDPAFRLGLHRLPAHDFPRLRESAPSLAGRGGRAELSAGVDALLDRVAGATG
ncbi:TetR/AcrR family transcriptional regulator C-terminal domain-containing protein [Streptomyces lavendulocolor]|uniref:TetR/AcrR family transcriptional regulator C-terminal domain-containing protein n=1 Tax=Streptomyces lavendulocolor TaxID=67316 RepID=UPI003C2CCB50